MMLPRPRSLFSRIFLHGLFVLGASTLSMALLGVVFAAPAFVREGERMGKWSAPLLCAHLRTETARTDESFLPATLYSTSGELLGSHVAPPMPPLDTADLARLRASGTIRAGGDSGSLLGLPPLAFLCPGGQSYVEFGPPLVPPLRGFLVAGAVMVLLIALASVPLARSIARPLGALVQAARDFGRGNLAVRADESRCDEVGDLGRAFNEMGSDLGRLIQSEKEMFANVSHELRTPLSRIRVALETARENPEAARRLLDEIATDLADLVQLVDTVMETMRLDLRAPVLSGGVLLPRFEPIDTGGAATHAVQRFRSVCPARRVELNLPKQPLLVEADPRLLRRVFDNLLDNAAKYSSEDSPITVSVTEEGDQPTIEVEDCGIGIGAADLAHVFTPFFRADRSRSRSTGGTGLGLALAKRIVDAHGGKISIRSTPKVGTAVAFTLRRSGG